MSVAKGLEQLPPPADVTAALRAGKFVSTQQFTSYLDWILKQPLIAPSDKGTANLSQEGGYVIQDIRDVLDGWKRLALEKNDDNQLQEFLYHTSTSALQNVRSNGKKQDTSAGNQINGEVSSDTSQILLSLRTISQILLREISPKDSTIAETVQYVAKDIAADAAETTEENARKMKEGLREQNRKQEEITRERAKKGGVEAGREKSDKERFEARMDQVKSAGSKGFELRDRVSEQEEALKREARNQFFNRIEALAKRSQQDEEFRSSAHTILDILRKYVRDKPTSTASGKNQPPPQITSLSDPSGHLKPALQSLNVLVSRLTNDPSKSLQHLVDVAWEVLQDLRNSSSGQAQDLRKWYDDADNFGRRVVDEEGYAGSDEGRKDGEEVWDRWIELTETIKEEGTKEESEQRQHLGRLRQTLEDYKQAITEDSVVNNLVESNMQLARDLGHWLGLDGAGGVGGLKERTQAIVSDLVGGILPRAFGMVEHFKVPRTEIVSEELEFVLDNLDLSKFSILPGNIRWSQTLDVSVSKPSLDIEAQSKTDTRGSLRFKGTSFAADNVSFYVKSKESPIKLGNALKEESGLADIELDEHGVEVLLEYELRNHDPKSSSSSSGAPTFYKLNNVTVKLHDFSLRIKDDKHSFLTSVFKSRLQKQVQKSIEEALSEQIREGFEKLDGIAWDTKMRIEVFRDTPGTNEIGAIIGGITSELGKLWREPGLLSGVSFTDTGVVKDAPESSTAFALGTAPQLLSGDKTGPNPAPLAEVGKHSDIKGAKDSAKDHLASRQRQIQSQKKRLEEEIEKKTEEEKKKKGWKTEKFDLRKT